MDKNILRNTPRGADNLPDGNDEAVLYKATHNETGEVTEMTEAQVRAEIIHMFQHDPGTFESDAEIVEGVTGSNIEDYFFDGVCETANYKITIA